MASLEYITKRVEGKEKEIAKLTKKLERIRKVEAQNWEDPNPYYYNEYDLKCTLRDLANAEAALADYKAKLAAETEKANSRNVPAIVQFLDMWKARMTQYYVNGLNMYFEEKEMVQALYKKIGHFYYKAETPEEIAYEKARDDFYKKRTGYFEKKKYTDRWGKIAYKKVKVATGEYEGLNPYSCERTLEAAKEKLEKDLAQEWNRKYDFIIERTNQIVGTITDASNLKIGAKADLNGYIIGTKGTANVQTIGAGGYNIQCYHFRTLITPVKGA